jgi:hypothetical protein
MADSTMSTVKNSNFAKTSCSTNLTTGAVMRNSMKSLAVHWKMMTSLRLALRPSYYCWRTRRRRRMNCCFLLTGH